MEFDHFFIRTNPGAPEAESLIDFGLTEGTANRHPGQGTANRRFFFCNAFLELLFVQDPTELHNELTKPTGLGDRLTSKDGKISPFGVCFRPQPATETVPFPSWEYKPSYLPAPLKVAIAKAPLTEPMWFFLGFGAWPDRLPAQKQQKLEHRVGFQEITSLKIVIPGMETFSVAARCAIETAGVEVIPGDRHLAIIGFDGECQGRSHDFQPALPLKFAW